MKKASKACKITNSGEIEDGDHAKSGSESTGPSEGSHEKDSRSILSSGCKLAGDLISQDSPQRDLHAKETVATQDLVSPLKCENRNNQKVEHLRGALFYEKSYKLYLPDASKLPLPY